MIVDVAVRHFYFAVIYSAIYQFNFNEIQEIDVTKDTDVYSALICF